MLNIQVVVTATLPRQPLTPGQIASMKRQISAQHFADELTNSGQAVLNLEIPEETDPQEFLKFSLKSLPDTMSVDDVLGIEEVRSYLRGCDQIQRSMFKSSIRNLRRGNITVLGSVRKATRQQLFKLRHFGQKRVDFVSWLFDLE